MKANGVNGGGIAQLMNAMLGANGPEAGNRPGRILKACCSRPEATSSSRRRTQPLASLVTAKPQGKANQRQLTVLSLQMGSMPIRASRT